MWLWIGLMCYACVALPAPLSSAFNEAQVGLYAKACIARDWTGLRIGTWQQLQQSPNDRRVICLHEISKVLCGYPPNVVCKETLLWYMIHNLDSFRLGAGAPQGDVQDGLLRCIQYVISNESLILEYPVYVQQFIYLRVARAAAACSATVSLKYAIGHLVRLPCSTMQKFYWRKVEYELDHGVLRRDFSIGSDEEINHYVCNWRDSQDKRARLAPQSKRGTREVDYASKLHINKRNVDSVFAHLRSRSVQQSECKRLVHEMIAQEYYEYAVDLLEWYGETIAPSSAAEAEAQARAYFMCCEFDRAAELLREWRLLKCELYQEVVRCM